MHWDLLNMDEFARYRQGEGMKLVKIKDLWWAEVRPFFFRPLFPFCEIRPWSERYPLKSCLGGFLHAVPPTVRTKRCINLHVYDDLPRYSLDLLSSNRRRLTRRALERFYVQPLGQEEFAEKGYEIYKIFYERTNYWYKKDRILKENFLEWTGNLFAFPKINKNGFFMEGDLVAIETSFRIDDIIFADYLFANDVGLKNYVVDFVQHKLRESAATTDARYLFLGLPTGKKSLDDSKLEKGCKVLRLPAYCKVNPFALTAARFCMKESYQKWLTIIGEYRCG